ncbi:hypothetical protein [Streptomyces lunaelactis]|nr:hypothetical protein [Streptomyces lunaelactis]
MNTQLLCRPALLSVLGTAAAAALLTSLTNSPAAGVFAQYTG